MTSYSYNIPTAVSWPIAYTPKELPKDATKDLITAINLELEDHYISEKTLAAIGNIIFSVNSTNPVYISRKNNIPHVDRSVAIIRQENTKLAFISLRTKVANAEGGQNISIKDMLMLRFDGLTKMCTIEKVVKLSSQFDERIKNFHLIERRISIMQTLDGYPYFPTNFAYLFRETSSYGFSSRKVCVYQKKALCDLLQYHEEYAFLDNLPFEQKRLILQTMVKAELILRAEGIMHRDLKFENYLVYRYPGEKFLQTCLTDFGLSCKVDDEKAFVDACGCLQWMPPEFFDDRPYTHIESTKALWCIGYMVHFFVHGRFHDTQNAVDPILEMSERKMTHYVPQVLQDKIAYDCYTDYKNVLEKLPPYPKDITSFKDIYEALLQKEESDRMSLYQLDAAIDLLGLFTINNK